MKQPSWWSVSAAGMSSSSSQPPPPRRRGTVMTTSTRHSIASSSNNILSCCDGNEDDDDSENYVCLYDDCAWEANAGHRSTPTRKDMAASPSHKLQGADTSNIIDIERPMHLQRQQQQGTASCSSSSESNNHCIVAMIGKEFSKLFTTTTTTSSRTFPGKNRQQQKQQQQQQQPSITCTSKTRTTTNTSTTSSTTILQEAKLRKLIKQYAQNEDWDSIRSLLSRHSFANVIPEKKVLVATAAAAAALKKRRGSSNSNINNGNSIMKCHNRRRRSSSRSDNSTLMGGGECVGGGGNHRRPSYESYSSGRRSFTTGGKESAAAAVVIQHAALLDCESNEDYSCEEKDDIVGKRGGGACNDVERGCDNQRRRSPSSTSSSRCRTATAVAATAANHRDDRPDIGENILHDLCRFQPPIDVLETILLGLRDRYRAGELYTVGTDRLGRTPLHVAAACGANASILDVLVRLDPTPASMGDFHGRSPLHLVLNEQPQQQQHRWRRHWLKCPFNSITRLLEREKRITSPGRSQGETYLIAQILKEAMLTYPGKIDFNDEDKMGCSPLDYAIERGIRETSLIFMLIRKNDPNTNACLLHSSDSLRLVHSASCCPEGHSGPTTTIIGNGEFLQSLDRDEIEALITKIRNLCPMLHKKYMECDLFKVLMDEEEVLLRTWGSCKRSPTLVESAGYETTSANDEIVVATETNKLGETPPPSHLTKVMTYEDIYNKHLQDYYDEYMHEMGDFRDEDDDFDIFVDPEELSDEMLLMNDTSSKPLCEISVVENDDDVSVLSVK